MSLLLPPLSPTFEAALRDVAARGVDMRIAAAQRLASPDAGRAREALEALLALSNDRDARVRAESVLSLSSFGAPAALPRIREALADDSALVRELSTITLARLTGDGVDDLLRTALESPHPEVRFQAVLGYVERDPAAAPAELAALLDDDDTRVRAATARALGGLGPEAAEPLLRALDDPDPSVVREAGVALAARGEPRAARAVCDAIDDPDLTIEALDALPALPSPQTREAAARLARSFLEPLVVKAAAARALLRMGDDRGMPALRSVLRAFRRDGRSFAVQVVGELRIAELAGELERLARRPRGTEPQVLASALATLAPDSEPARRGLALLAQRQDTFGEQARSALNQPR